MFKLTIVIILAAFLCGCSNTANPPDGSLIDPTPEIETFGANEGAGVTGADFAGEWHRTNVWSSMPSVITITNVTGDGFDFYIEAFYWSHIGMFDGKAVLVDETRAVSTLINDSELELPENDYAQLDFLLDGSNLIIPVYDYEKGLPVGANVSVDGEYVKGEPEYTNADNYRKIVPNDEVAAIIEELLGDEMYAYFQLAAYDGYIEPCEVEGHPGYRITTATIGGLEYRIAVFDENKVFLWQDGWGESELYSNE